MNIKFKPQIFKSQKQRELQVIFLSLWQGPDISIHLYSLFTATETNLSIMWIGSHMTVTFLQKEDIFPKAFGSKLNIKIHYQIFFLIKLSTFPYLKSKLLCEMRKIKARQRSLQPRILNWKNTKLFSMASNCLADSERILLCAEHLKYY